jgi:hypothetical protein
MSILRGRKDILIVATGSRVIERYGQRGAWREGENPRRLIEHSIKKMKRPERLAEQN